MRMIFLWLMTAILTGSPAQQQPANQRFDYLVRADFFAGFAGDEARLKKAMDACEQAPVSYTHLTLPTILRV